MVTWLPFALRPGVLHCDNLEEMICAFIYCKLHIVNVSIDTAVGLLHVAFPKDDK